MAKTLRLNIIHPKTSRGESLPNGYIKVEKVSPSETDTELERHIPTYSDVELSDNAFDSDYYVRLDSNGERKSNLYFADNSPNRVKFLLYEALSLNTTSE